MLQFRDAVRFYLFIYLFIYYLFIYLLFICLFIYVLIDYLIIYLFLFIYLFIYPLSVTTCGLSYDAPTVSEHTPSKVRTPDNT